MASEPATGQQRAAVNGVGGASLWNSQHGLPPLLSSDSLPGCMLIENRTVGFLSSKGFLDLQQGSSEFKVSSARVELKKSH